MEDTTDDNTTQATDLVEEQKEEEIVEFIMPGKDKQLEKAEDLDKEAIEWLKQNVANIERIKLSGHSYGLGACEHIGDILADAKKLKHIDFSNCFIGKLKDQIPINLKALLKNLEGTEVVSVDLSDNAFGPSGVPGFETFIKNTPSIKSLRMMNCGLGPAGGTSLAEFLKASQVKLLEFCAGRNRLENKGFTELASVITEMGSLTKIEVPQNFVKEGMIEMIAAFKSNPNLEEVRIHDNWLKEGAIDALTDYLKNHAQNLKVLNISDCDIGGLGVKRIVRAIGVGACKNSLTEIGLNYNEIERTKTAKYIFDVFRLCPNLSTVHFVGNLIKPQLRDQFKQEFAKASKVLVLKDEGAEDEDEDEEEDDLEELSSEDEEGDDAEQDNDDTKELEKMFQDLHLD